MMELARVYQHTHCIHCLVQFTPRLKRVAACVVCGDSGFREGAGKYCTCEMGMNLGRADARRKRVEARRAAEFDRSLALMMGGYTSA